MRLVWTWQRGLLLRVPVGSHAPQVGGTWGDEAGAVIRDFFSPRGKHNEEKPHGKAFWSPVEATALSGSAGRPSAWLHLKYTTVRIWFWGGGAWFLCDSAGNSIRTQRSVERGLCCCSCGFLSCIESWLWDLLFCSVCNNIRLFSGLYAPSCFVRGIVLKRTT